MTVGAGPQDGKRLAAACRAGLGELAAGAGKNAHRPQHQHLLHGRGHDRGLKRRTLNDDGRGRVTRLLCKTALGQQQAIPIECPIHILRDEEDRLIFALRTQPADAEHAHRLHFRRPDAQRVLFLHPLMHHQRRDKGEPLGWGQILRLQERQGLGCVCNLSVAAPGGPHKGVAHHREQGGIVAADKRADKGGHKCIRCDLFISWAGSQHGHGLAQAAESGKQTARHQQSQAGEQQTAPISSIL